MIYMEFLKYSEKGRRAMQFDLTDRKIISILQKDGRITMKHLGELINMSTPSTIDRVRRLEEAGVIKGYAAVVDYIALGYDMHIYIFVEVNQNKRPGLLEYIAKNQLIAGLTAWRAARIWCWTCTAAPANLISLWTSFAPLARRNPT